MSSEDPTKGSGAAPRGGGASDPGPAAGSGGSPPPQPDPNRPGIPEWVAKQHPDLAGGAGAAPPGAPAAPSTGAPAPAPPAQAARAAPAQAERREFLHWLALGWIAFSAASAAGLTAMARFFFPNVLFEPPSLFKVGFPEDFTDGEVDNRFKEKYRVWIVRDGGVIYALYAQCTHLGCTPNWLAAENKFKCPCHGSGFYRSGINFEGPAPRPLERLKISLAEDDGQILIDKNVVFQQEKGQWNDPASFLTV
jgi:cytochrome b6-f complex iron-sulfur subunit